MYFLLKPALEVVKTTGISPESPGFIGVFGQPFKTVQPQPAFTEFISKEVLPIFLNTNVCSTFEPRATVSKLNIKSLNSIIGGYLGLIKSAVI